MTQLHKKIGENRYREEYGLYYEDFIPGDVYEHRPGRTITLADNIWQSLINLNQHPLHIDEEYGKQTEFGKVLVSSLVTFCAINGMTVNTLSANAVANLGWDNVRLNSPVFVGDTLYAESKILSKRESQKRPHQGIITAETKGLKQDGTQVITFERTFLVPKKAHGIDYRGPKK